MRILSISIMSNLHFLKNFLDNASLSIHQRERVKILLSFLKEASYRKN